MALAAATLAMLAALAFCLVVTRQAPRAGQAITVSPKVTVRAVKPVVEEQKLVPLAPDAARAFNAERPVAAEPLVAARPYVLAGAPEDRTRATDCLAAAGWYEIGDDARGQRAVMQVVLNRARHSIFPQSVCGVVFQGSERSTGCQFTFTCDGSLLRREPSPAAWARARGIAEAALAGAVDREVGLATHYHADYVVPYWASSLEKSAQVGPHLFYRWPGFWGTKAAFVSRNDGDEPVVAALTRLSPAHRVGPADPALPAISLPVTLGEVAVAPPPAIVVAGVREKSLRGAVVRGETAESGRYFLQLDAGTFPGNYATAAVALCKDKPGCMVLGWRDTARMGQSLPLTAAQHEALSFSYTQGSDGTGRALWNCQQMPRSNKAQCLTAGDPT